MNFVKNAVKLVVRKKQLQNTFTQYIEKTLVKAAVLKGVEHTVKERNHLDNELFRKPRTENYIMIFQIYRMKSSRKRNWCTCNSILQTAIKYLHR